jgi:hypothetical protein
LASGGVSPVATFNGNAAALASGPADVVLEIAGTSIVNDVFSGSGAANVTAFTSSPLSSLSKTGFMGAPAGGAELDPFRRLRETGAEKRSTIGRTGRHAAFARSRSQLNSALKALRTR